MRRRGGAARLDNWEAEERKDVVIHLFSSIHPVSFRLFYFSSVPRQCSGDSYPELCAQRTIEVKDFFAFARGCGEAPWSPMSNR